MDTILSWLQNHNYDLVNIYLENNNLLKIRDRNNNCKRLLKIISVKKLDTNAVIEAVNGMNRLNQLNINGLLKYKIIEHSDNALYRISREYKMHLDEINPLKYFEESDPYKILKGIIMVLKSLDENRLFHSDLKPSNIFINDEDEVVIGDYLNSLLYKGREGLKNDGNRDDICFVCIDELLGLELDIRSDIWNFGLIFYYVLSGKYPFVGSNMLETIDNIRDVKYTPLNCEYGSKLNTFLNKVLIKEKENRIKLDEIISELKSIKYNSNNNLCNEIELNEPELPVKPFEEENKLKVSERVSIIKYKYNLIKLENKISIRIDYCKKYDDDKLNFEKFYMKDDGMEFFHLRLYTMDNITYINVMFNDITSVGLNTFSKCLKFFPNLEELLLHDNLSNGLKIFSENLHFNTKLKKLGLWGCGLLDNDMKYLSFHFKELSNLEILNISVNEISNDGVKYLCKYISDLSKLKELWLNNNEISDNGGENLINNLRKCKDLKELEMKGNKISNYDNFKRRMKMNHPNKALNIDSY